MSPDTKMFSMIATNNGQKYTYNDARIMFMFYFTCFRVHLWYECVHLIVYVFRGG